MPNLDHDPQKPTDILNRPIKEGDVCAWGTNYSQSAAICIGVIDKIVFTRKKLSGYGNEKCEKWQAEDYYVRFRPLHGTNMISWVHAATGTDEWKTRRDKSIPERRDAPDEYVGKIVTIKLVKNLCKLDLTEKDVEHAIRVR